MNEKIALRKIMSDTLLRLAKDNKEMVVLTSDSRGSALLGDYANTLPKQHVEVGIAEQNIVGISAGLALNGKRPFAVSPASFLSMRSIEQIKVDVAYSNKNVKLVGISGGVSYGALGMSHHSLQDIAVTRAIPNLDVILPSDAYETEKIFEYLSKSNKPAYIRIGRNPVASCFDDSIPFEYGKASRMRTGDDVLLVATGETVRIAMDASDLLKEEGIEASVLNYHAIKPFDEEALLELANKANVIVSIEEHSIHGGLGAAVAETLSPHNSPVHLILGIPDEPAVTGNTEEVFNHYGLTPKGVQTKVREALDAYYETV